MNVKVNNGNAMELVNRSGLTLYVHSGGGGDVPQEVVDVLLNSDMHVLLYWKNLNGMKVWRLNHEEVWGTVGMPAGEGHDPIGELCQAAGLVPYNAQFEDIVMANYEWNPPGILGRVKKQVIHMAFERTQQNQSVGMLAMVVEETLSGMMSDLEDEMDLVVYMQ